MKVASRFPWSDNWCLDGEKAYFCAGRITALFCVDIGNGQCEMVSKIPDCHISAFRLFPYCIKKGSNIFCIPGWGRDIWIYNLQTSSWEKVVINNDCQLIWHLCFIDVLDSNRIWLTESISRRIFQLNLNQRLLEKTYPIEYYGNLYTGQHVLVGNRLYCVVGIEIYCINIDTAETIKCKISGAKSELYTICYDGEKFWLSGWYKEIYVWMPKQGIIKVLSEFPKQFGFYCFNDVRTCSVDFSSLFSKDFHLFSTSLSLGKYIWFIPNISNYIIYINKETYEINALEIEDEEENLEELKSVFNISKYLVQYIRENRYIGVYSAKRSLIFEIDTINADIIYKDYRLSSTTVSRLVNEYYKPGSVLLENNSLHRKIFQALLNLGSSFGTER